jgi:hypothetical protein
LGVPVDVSERLVDVLLLAFQFFDDLGALHSCTFSFAVSSRLVRMNDAATHKQRSTISSR